MAERSEKPEQYMVERVGAFSTHWSDPQAVFGPMSEEEAREMCQSKYGGTMVPLSRWAKERHA